MSVTSPDFIGSENTMEALREFLQNMKRTVERLHASHTLATHQTLKSGSSDNAQSSYNLDMLSTPSKAFSQPTQSALPDGVGKPGEMQNWFFPQTVDSSQVASKHEVTGKTNLNVPISEMDLGNAISVFLEDMKKTIEAWSNRYHLLIGGRIPLVRDGSDVEALSPPLDTTVHVIDQLDFAPDIEHNFCVIEVLDLPNAESLQGSAQSQNGRPQRARGRQGRKSKKVHFQGNKSKGDATSFSLQDFNELMGSQVSLHDQGARPQSLIGSQECAENDCNTNHTGQMDVEQQYYDNADYGNLGMDEVCGNDMQGVDSSLVLMANDGSSKAGQKKRKSRQKAPTTLVNSQEITIRRFHYKVEVVESPDWLPKGWVTELKTRSTGGSAGCKDKYYFDPVSKRRCRSQKEVFSLLETGKLGRYKRKTKPQPAETPATAEVSPVPKMSDIAETSSSDKQEVLGERSSATPVRIAHESTVGTVSTPPPAIAPGEGQMGVVNNMFAPYRPGQPSDWGFYESLANIPHTVSENLHLPDPNLSKPNGERGSPCWPGFPNNSESSMRPTVDRFEMGKAAVMCGREDALGNGQPPHTEHSAKRLRKALKKMVISS